MGVWGSAWKCVRGRVRGGVRVVVVCVEWGDSAVVVWALVWWRCVGGTRYLGGGVELG
jgi:hypothetical protein